MLEIPPALEEMQIWFGEKITRIFRKTGEFNLPLYSDSLIDEIRGRIAPSPTLKAEERLAIYNQQYWWRLFVLLQEYFPTLVRLFGFRDFNTLVAEPYLLRYPPNDWFLPLLGQHLVQWIREDYREADRDLLLHAASIDFAYERLFHVGSNPTPTPESFSEKLFLQPSIALFELNADFFAFRKSLLEHDVNHWQKQALPELLNAKKKYYFVLYRTKEGLFYQELQEPQYRLLTAFQKGAYLTDACGCLDPACAPNIGDWFKTWMEKNFFAL